MVGLRDGSRGVAQRGGAPSFTVGGSGGGSGMLVGAVGGGGRGEQGYDQQGDVGLRRADLLRRILQAMRFVVCVV